MVNVVPLPKTAENFEFSYRARREALGPYVASRWGWNGAQQREVVGGDNAPPGGTTRGY